MNTTYNGIEITYEESSNRWLFTIRGRDKSAESLAKAKEMINSQPKEKKEPFKKISAWYFHWDCAPVKVEVTGIAEPDWNKKPCIWMKNDGKRSKQSVEYYIFPQNEVNDAKAQQCIEKEDQIKQLKKEISDIKKTLLPLVLPDESHP